METSTPPELEPQLNRREEDERKGGGFFISLLQKLGLRSAGPTGGFGAAGSAGVSGGLLATKAGIVALVLAGSTVAAGIGVILKGQGRSGSGEGIFAVFPDAQEARDGASGAAEDAAAEAGKAGVSSSLDYFASANQAEAAPKESSDAAGAAGAQGGAAEGAAAGSASSDKAAPDNSNAPANVGGAGANRPRMVKSPGFFGSNSSGAGGGGSLVARAPQGPGSGLGTGSRTAATSAFSRTRTGGGRSMKAKVASGGRGASQQAISARNTGARVARGSGGMQAAGTTFDAGTGIQGVEGGGVGPGGPSTGEGAPASRFRPNSVIDQREVPNPPSAKKKEKNATPYQGILYAAIAALAIAALAFMVMGYFKNKAKEGLALMSNPLTASVGLAQYTSNLGYAKLAAMLAAAAGAVATVMGIMLMTTYGQTLQGLIFTGIGGILTIMSAVEWMNLGSDSSDALKKEISAEIKPNVADINQNLLNNGQWSQAFGQRISAFQGLAGGPLSGGGLGI